MKIKILYVFLWLSSINLVAKFYSQWGQDKCLNSVFFKNKKNGVFVEIGASDGVEYSNTLFYEEDLGWRGILVEPHPQKYAELVINRPKSVCINGCISAREGSLDFLQITGYAAALSGILDSYDPRHLARVESELKKFGGEKKIIKVPTFLFNKILDQNKITHIDLLSIDVEGSEEEIIKSIDFDRFDISVILIEDNYGNKSLRKFIESKGYKRAKRIVTDDVFIQEKFANFIS